MIHKTRYEYVSTVYQSHNTGHLLPIVIPGQSMGESSVTLNPLPAEIHHHSDYFGNCFSLFRIDVAHDELDVTAKFWVEREERHLPKWDLTWKDAQTIFTREAHHLPKDCWACLPQSKATLHLPELALEFEQILHRHPTFTEGCHSIMSYIFETYKFDGQASTVSTPIIDIYRQKRGVCQDFSHIMLSGLRSLGIPCKYVSGYIETLPPPGEEKLVGVDASHAWISVFVPGYGWLDLDPTNNMVPSLRHVSLASGRDYHDVSPLKGHFVGNSQHQLSVSVDVREWTPNQTVQSL